MPYRQVLADTVGLSTKVEEDFISPLTAVRGALEILRDYDDLTDEERCNFINRALSACKRLEQGVDDLSDVVYAAARQPSGAQSVDFGAAEFTDRITVHREKKTIEVDFSDYEFRNSEMVNAFFDVIDRIFENENGKQYFVFNQRNCRVWPEAWIAFAHRSKKIRIADALGVVRFAEIPPNARDDRSQQDLDDPLFFTSRDAAFEALEQIKAHT